MIKKRLPMIMFAQSSILGFALAALVAGCSGVRPSQLGVQEGKLAPCPPSPNCVSTQSPDSEHSVAPLKFTTTVADAAADLKKVILGMKRARIVREEDSYLHAEYTSLIWRFVDDVEFFLDDSTKTVHIRSASRLGRSDFGVNRKRVEEIRVRWKSSGAAPAEAGESLLTTGPPADYGHSSPRREPGIPGRGIEQ